MATLKQLKELQGSNKLLVFGYIRKLEKEINITGITMLILYKILEYFYINEYFCKYGDVIQVSQDKKTITRIGTMHAWNNNSYGKIWFKSNGNEIARWKFKIDVLLDGNEMYFQFLSKDGRPNEDAGDPRDKPNYAWSNRYDYDMCGEGQYVGRDNVVARHYPEEGDQVEIELNTKNGSIRWKVSHHQYQNAFINIEQADHIKYKMAITLHAVGTKITLVDFVCFNKE